MQASRVLHNSTSLVVHLVNVPMLLFAPGARSIADMFHLTICHVTRGPR